MVRTVIAELNQSNPSVSDGEDVNVIPREAIERDEGRVHGRVFLGTTTHMFKAGQRSRMGRAEKGWKRGRSSQRTRCFQ